MRVTIGLPFLNAEDTLGDAIRSVFAQTYTDWELILLDDGSTDRSARVARSVTDPRVRVISDGVNRGLHARLNQISAMAQGEFVARMDADDLMHPSRLQRQIELLDLDPNLDIVGTGVYIIDASTNPIEIRDIAPIDPRPKSVMAQAILPHPTITGRVDWFTDNPYDESFTRAEDYELWCRTYAKTRFAKINEPLYYFREGARDPKKYLKDYIRTARAVRMALRKHGPSAIGHLGTWKLIALSCAKEAAYKTATAAHMQSALIDLRHKTPLSESQLARAIEDIRLISTTEVPGLRPPNESYVRREAWHI